MLFSTVNGTTKKEAESEPLMMPWSHQALLGDDHDDEYEYEEKPEKKREVDASINSGGNQNSMWNMWNVLCASIWVTGIALAFYDTVTMQNRVVLPGGHIDIGHQKGRLSKTTLTGDVAKAYAKEHGRVAVTDRRQENINQLLFLLDKASGSTWTCRKPVNSSQFKNEALELRKKLQTKAVLYDDDVDYDALVKKADTCGQSLSEGPRMLAVLDKLVFNRRFVPKCALWKLKWSIRLLLLLFWVVVGFGAYLLCTKLSSEGGFPLGPYIAIVGMSALIYVILGFTVVDDKSGGSYLYPKNPCSLHTTLLIFAFVAAISVPFLIIYGSQDFGKTFGISWFHAGVATVVLSLLYFFVGYGALESVFVKHSLSMYWRVSCHCVIICLIVGFWLITACKYFLESNCAGTSSNGFEHTPMLFGFLVIIAFIILSLVIPATVSLKGGEKGSLWWSPAVFGLVILAIFLIGWFAAYTHIQHGEFLAKNAHHDMVETKFAFNAPMWSIFPIFFGCVLIGVGLVIGTYTYNQYKTGVESGSTLNSFRMAFCAVFVLTMFVSIAIVTAMDKTGQKDPVDVACVCLSVLFVLWFFVQPIWTCINQDTNDALTKIYADSEGKFFRIIVSPFAAMGAVGLLLGILQAQKNNNTVGYVIGAGVILLLLVACESFFMAIQCNGGKELIKHTDMV